MDTILWTALMFLYRCFNKIAAQVPMIVDLFSLRQRVQVHSLRSSKNNRAFSASSSIRESQQNNLLSVESLCCSTELTPIPHMVFSSCHRRIPSWRITYFLISGDFIHCQRFVALSSDGFPYSFTFRSQDMNSVIGYLYIQL